MKPVERVELTINGQIPDTVPVFPRDLTLGLDVLDYTTPEVCAGSYDPVKSARSVIALQRIVKMAESLGLKTVFHPHGTFVDRFESLVDESIETGIAGFQFPEGNDLRMAKNKWGSSTCIMGGIDVRTTVLLGPGCRIRREVEEIMESCKPGGNYIFMCSGSLHRGLPLDHLKVMMIACRESGTY